MTEEILPDPPWSGERAFGLGLHGRGEGHPYRRGRNILLTPTEKICVERLNVHQGI